MAKNWTEAQVTRPPDWAYDTAISVPHPFDSAEDLANDYSQLAQDRRDGTSDHRAVADALELRPGGPLAFADQVSRFFRTQHPQ